MQPHQEKESLDCEQATIWEEAFSPSFLMLKLARSSHLGLRENCWKLGENGRGS